MERINQVAFLHDSEPDSNVLEFAHTLTQLGWRLKVTEKIHDLLGRRLIASELIDELPSREVVDNLSPATHTKDSISIVYVQLGNIGAELDRLRNGEITVAQFNELIDAASLHVVIQATIGDRIVLTSRGNFVEILCLVGGLEEGLSLDDTNYVSKKSLLKHRAMQEVLEYTRVMSLFFSW